MNSNLPASDKAAIVGVCAPKNGTTVTSSAWVKASDFYQFLAIVAVGTIAAGGTVDAKVEQATDAAGTGAKDVTGKVITQLTNAGADSDKQALINLDHGDLDRENGFSHFRLTITPATGNGATAGVLLGLEPRYAPASGFDAASVAEIVA